jgi:hypothetical protein
MPEALLTGSSQLLTSTPLGDGAMKKSFFLFFSFSFCILLNSSAQTSIESEESVAMGIVYDTSGSMSETVRDESGKMSPKYVIANRALTSVVNRLQDVTQSKSEPRKVLCNLVVFQGNGAREAVTFDVFNNQTFLSWIKQFSTPTGSTPLGEAIRVAAKPVLASKSKHKHILILTDGINSAGPSPSEVIPALQKEAERNGNTLSFYFVAFDVAAKVFDPVKKLGSMVVSAANEKELNAQLGFILEEKILLEAEEPSVKKNPVKK